MMAKSNLAKNLAVIVKGFIAMVMQIILIREFLIIFNGNELSLGIILASWLFLEAMGSGIIAKLFSKIKDNLRAYIILQILIILSLPLTIWLARIAKVNLGIFYGELVNLPQMFLISFITLFLFSILDGIQFSFACRLFLKNKTEASSISQAYILEALGMLLGGVVFTCVFLPLFNSFQITILLASLAIAVVFYLCLISTVSHKRTILGILIALLTLNLILALSGKIDLWQKLSLEKQFPQQKILDYQNSIYGNIIVAQQQNQLTFFSNGSPIVVTPITDIAFAEEFVHLTLLYHPAPEDILLISGGAGGILNEILKQPINQISYAELDPLIIREIQKFPSKLTSQELNDRRLNIIYQDGRRVVKNSQKKYDVIFINVASPTTLQINRLFTQEFYQETKNILKRKGILSLRLPGSLTYLNEELRQLNNCIYKTLSSVYKYVLVVPGDFNLFLASNSLDLQNTPVKTILARFKQRNLETHLLTEFSLGYRLDKSWRDWFFKQLESVKDKKFLNKDFLPQGLFFGLSFLYSLICPQTKNIFKFISKINFSTLIILIFIIYVLFILLNKRNKGLRNKSLIWLMLISGFSGITWELTLILGFQIIYGFVYAWVGILTAGFMFGLAAAGTILNKKLNKLKNNFTILLKLEFAIIVFSLVLPLSLIALSQINLELWALLIKTTFLLLSFCAGFLLGGEFPLVNQLYFRNQEFSRGREGQLYAADLIGASTGAILASVVLIPVLGIWETAGLIVCLKLWAVATIIFAVKK